MRSHLDEGRGIPVVLVHGFANDRLLWWPQVEALGSQCRVIAPDLRGCGTDAPTDGEAVTMDQYADDVVALMDELGIERAVVGGISLGGYVSLSIALRFPQRVLGLILANTRATADNATQRANRDTLAADIAKRGAVAVAEALGEKPLRPDAAAAIKAEIRAMNLRQPPMGLRSSTLGMRDRPDRTPRLAEIRAPTLVVTGTADIFIPPAESEAIHKGIAGSTFVNLPGAGHLSNIDSAAAFNGAAGRFLAGLPRAAR